MILLRGQRREQKKTRARAKKERANNRKALEVIIQAKLKRMEAYVLTVS